jgi:hypothetical protein
MAEAESFLKFLRVRVTLKMVFKERHMLCTAWEEVGKINSAIMQVLLSRNFV